MKWVGQQIYDLTSRFRNSVYLEDISSGTIASGGYLGLDSNNKIVKAASEGDITGITLTAGTGVDLTSISGATGGAYAATIGVDVSDFMSNGGNGNIVTATGADAMTAHTYLTFTNDAGETDTSLLSILSNQDAGDKFTIATTTHGATTITTIDDDAAAAHLTFVIDGDIKNIPESGTVYFYKSTNTDDYVKLDVGNDGDAKFTTLDAAATAAHFEIEADGNIILDAAGDIALEAAGNDVTVDADNLTMTSATEGKPVLTLKTTHTTSNKSAELQFLKDAADTEDGENLGLITFYGEDEGNSNTKFAQIKGAIAESDHAAEGGVLRFAVASHDGEMINGLVINDGDAEDEIDVTIGSTTSSLTTVAGNLTISGNTLSFDSSIGRRGYFELTGYSVADGSNYFYSNIMSGNKAPFLHDVNIGSDGLTADNPAAFLRANGTVMPYAGTLKMWKGWGASNGTPTVSVAIFKYTPTADDATNASLVLVKNTNFTGAGNDNLKTFSETSFSVTVAAGDILITAIKGTTNAKTAYFVSTVEIEWTS